MVALTSEGTSPCKVALKLEALNPNSTVYCVVRSPCRRATSPSRKTSTAGRGDTGGSACDTGCVKMADCMFDRMLQHPDTARDLVLQCTPRLCSKHLQVYTRQAAGCVFISRVCDGVSQGTTSQQQAYSSTWAACCDCAGCPGRCKVIQMTTTHHSLKMYSSQVQGLSATHFSADIWRCHILCNRCRHCRAVWLWSWRSGQCLAPGRLGHPRV